MDESEFTYILATVADETLFAELRELCMSLPDVAEEYPWGHATWKVRGKMFALGDAEGPWVTVKTTFEDMEALVQDPAIVAAPYLASKGWVNITFTDRETTDLALELTRISYDLVVKKLPKGAQREIAERLQESQNE